MVIMEDTEECCVVPPGFRFHPTEEELVGYYLARKVSSSPPHNQTMSSELDLDIIIPEVDLYRMEPWDLLQRQRTNNKYGGGGDECYFFSHKDRKYPSGTRTNRATAAGFWKATGRDKPVLSSISSAGGGAGRVVIGMRKTLVFYKGRAPNGRKTDWIMHEYRLLHSSHRPNNLVLPPPHAHAQQQQQQEEGWVVCRAFQKPIPNQQQLYHHHHPPTSTGGRYGDDDHHRFFQGSSTSSSSLPLTTMMHPQERRREIFPHQLYHKDQADDLFEFESKNKRQHRIPQLIDSPPAAVVDDVHNIQHQQQGGGGGGEQQLAAAGAIDWNFLDTLLLSSSTLLHDPSSSSYLQLQ